MRLCAALALVLVALVVVTVKATQRHPRPSSTSIEPAPAASPRAAARAPERAAAARAAPVEPGGMAHLRGRLLLPAGVDPTSALDVMAEGSVRRFRALIPDDTRYEIHLPSGRYTLVASM